LNKIEVLNAHPITRLKRQSFRSCVESVLRWGGVSDATISVILLDDSALLKLNRDYLNHNYFTDVMTFPLEVEPLEGEIYISVDRARDQADERSIPLYEEVSRLAIHGTLHLLGYDDKTEQERKAMIQLENKFLKQVG